MPPITRSMTIRNQESWNLALNNEVVLRHVFSFMTFEQLKTCRLVCRKWQDRTKTRFVNSAVISIQSWKNNMKCFVHDFPYNSIFIHFHFQGNFSESILERFFNRYPNITQLTLTLGGVKNQHGQYLLGYDISRWAKLRLRALKVLPYSAQPPKTRLVIPFRFLEHIETLFLQGCVIWPNGRIAPTTLDILWTAWTCLLAPQEPSGRFQSLDLNEYVDLRNLNSLGLHCCPVEQNQTIHVNLANCFQLESLSVTNVIATGLHPYLKLKKVILVSTYVDLSKLPACVEKLGLHKYNRCHTMTTVSADLKFLSNLKYLHYSGTRPLIQLCQNVVDMDISHSWIDLDILPAGLRTLTLKNICQFRGQRQMKLDKLVFDEFNAPVEYFLSIIEMFSPNTVVMYKNKVWVGMAQKCTEEDCHNIISSFEQLMEQRVRGGGRFRVDQIRWEHLYPRGVFADFFVGYPFYGITNKQPIYCLCEQESNRKPVCIGVIHEPRFTYEIFK